jgi:transmembrane sensor
MKLFGQSSRTEAARWFARVRSGEIDSPTDKAWTDWMAADEAHAKAYEDLELTWELAEELRQRPEIQGLLKDLDQTLQQSPTARTRTRPFGLRMNWPLGLAACALLGICALATLFVVDRPVRADYATDVGEQKTVTLADNSVIALNTATHVQVTYSRSLRRVDLLAGEALFEVNKDSRRPFEVHALHGSTTAVGTEFDVHVTDAEAAVTVLKGTVRVKSTETAPPDKASLVSAGQATDYTAEGMMSVIRKADIDKVRAWQAKRILIADEALSDALNDYNRYIKVPITIGDPALASRHINGVFRIGDEEAFLNALKQGLHVSVVRTDSTTVLQPR